MTLVIALFLYIKEVENREGKGGFDLLYDSTTCSSVGSRALARE